jgi:hypothetical protein
MTELTCAYCDKPMQPKKGGGSPRRYCSRACAQRAYYYRHHEKCLRAAAEYVAKNPERHRIHEIASRRKRRLAILVRSAIYREANREYLRLRQLERNRVNRAALREARVKSATVAAGYVINLGDRGQ